MWKTRQVNKSLVSNDLDNNLLLQKLRENIMKVKSYWDVFVFWNYMAKPFD